MPLRVAEELLQVLDARAHVTAVIGIGRVAQDEQVHVDVHVGQWVFRLIGWNQLMGQLFWYTFHS